MSKCSSAFIDARRSWYSLAFTKANSSPEKMRKFLLLAVLIPLVLAAGWYYFHERSLPAYGPLYREYAYVTNGKSNTVSVIDLTTDPFKGFTVVRTLAVGAEPTGVAANPKKNEVYVVNAGSANVSVSVTPVARTRISVAYAGPMPGN